MPHATENSSKMRPEKQSLAMVSVGHRDGVSTVVRAAAKLE